MEVDIEIEQTMEDQHENSISFMLPSNFIVAEDCDGSPLNLVPFQISDSIDQPPSIADLGKQLLKASEAGQIDEIKLLMHRGAPFTADWLGTSPLHFASQHNHLEVCKILLRAGISKDARTKVERTPLHLAVYYGHVDIVKCLVANNSDINCKDMLLMTPLHWAAQIGNAEIAQFLVQCGAEIDAPNKFGLTPTDIALQIDREDIATIINTVVRQLEASQEDVAYHPTISINSEPNSPIPLETIIEVDDIDSENSIDPERLHIPQEELVEQDYFSGVSAEEFEAEVDDSNDKDKLTASIKFLQQHGITMLPADDTNIFSSILETGRSVTLTEVGKQVLNSTKPNESTSSTKIVPKLKTVPTKKVVHVLPQEYVRVFNDNDLLKQLNGKIIKTSTKPITKRIVMKKNKTLPIALKQTTKSNNVSKIIKETTPISDVDSLRKQLMEARRLVEDYKQKYISKSAEAEKYKMLLLAQSKNLC